MGIGNILVLSQVTVFLISFILSFFIFVPLSVNQREFDGHCLLYSDGQWKTNGTESGVPELTNVQWGPHSACGFSIFMGVIIMLLSLFYVIWESIYLLKDTDSSWLTAFLTAILCILISLMLFSSSLTLSVGFQKWCNLLEQPVSQIVSCEQADYISFADEIKDLKTNDFYIEIKMAECGGWACFVCWLALTVMAILKVHRYQRNESFRSSMDRERERLLQRVRQNTGQVVT